MENVLDGERVRLSMSWHDLLNYIVPGGTLLTLLVVFEILAPSREPQSPERFKELWTTVEPFVTNHGWLVPTLLGFAVLLGSYVAGHLVDSISMLCIDRTLVYKGYGYPYEILLVPTPRSAQEEAWAVYSGHFYRGSFFLLNGYLVLRFVELVFRHKGMVLSESISTWAARGVILLFILQVFMKLACSGVVARHHPKWRRRFDEGGDLASFYRFARVSTRISSFAMDVIGNALQSVLNTGLSFNEDFKTKYQERFREFFGLDADKAQSNNYWMSYFFVMHRSPALTFTIRRWETLYLFSRNLATAMFVFFLYVLVWIYAHSGRLKWADPSVGTALVVAGFAFLTAAILLVHFYYLYVSYSSKTLYRSFVFLAEQNEREHARR